MLVQFGTHICIRMLILLQNVETFALWVVTKRWDTWVSGTLRHGHSFILRDKKATVESVYAVQDCRSASRCRVYVASASRYPSRIRICGRLLIAAMQSSHLNQLPKSTKVRSHGNNVRDVIIAHMISADAHTYIYIYIYTDAETAK